MVQHQYNDQAIHLLNHASVEELDRIPGMSTKVAKSIYHYCQTTEVVAWDDLLNLENVSSQRTETIRSYFITKAAERKSNHHTIFHRVLNSTLFRVLGLIGTVFLFIFAIIEGIASF